MIHAREGVDQSRGMRIAFHQLREVRLTIIHGGELGFHRDLGGRVPGEVPSARAMR